MKFDSINFKHYLGKGIVKPDDKAKVILDKYQAKQKEEEVISIEFSATDTNGDLYTFDGPVKIILPNKELYGKKYDSYDRADKLMYPYGVSVKALDYEKGEVIVSRAQAVAIDRERLKSALDQCIKDEEYCEVPARVVRVLPHLVVIDLGGLGIPGYIRIKEWSKTYTESFRGLVNNNDLVIVSVKSKGMEKKLAKSMKWQNDEIFYECSRREAMKVDPWEGIEERFPEKAVVRVTCTLKRDRNFFGRIKGLDEINVYCEYPDGNIRIIEGFEYEGYVARVSEKTQLLRVRIFRQLTEPRNPLLAK